MQHRLIKSPFCGGAPIIRDHGFLRALHFLRKRRMVGRIASVVMSLTRFLKLQSVAAGVVLLGVSTAWSAQDRTAKADQDTSQKQSTEKPAKKQGKKQKAS